MAHEFTIIADKMIRGKHRHPCMGDGFGQSQKCIQDCGSRSALLGLNHQVFREYLLEQFAVMAFVRARDRSKNPIVADCERNAKTSLFDP